MKADFLKKTDWEASRMPGVFVYLAGNRNANFSEDSETTVATTPFKVPLDGKTDVDAELAMLNDHMARVDKIVRSVSHVHRVPDPKHPDGWIPQVLGWFVNCSVLDLAKKDIVLSYQWAVDVPSWGEPSPDGRLRHELLMPVFANGPKTAKAMYTATLVLAERWLRRGLVLAGRDFDTDVRFDYSAYPPLPPEDKWTKEDRIIHALVPPGPLVKVP